MKKLILILPILFFISCQKEYTPKAAINLSADNAEVSQDDFITFDPYEPGSLPDNGSGRVVCSAWTFNIDGANVDSAYPKRFTAIIHKDGNIQVGQLILYIDGERVKTVNNPESDTVQINVVSPEGKGIALINPTSFRGNHFLTFRLAPPDGVTNTGSYHVDLVEAAFLNKNDSPQTLYQVQGLPLQGDLCTY